MIPRRALVVVVIVFPYRSAWTGNSRTFFYIGTGMSMLAIACWLVANPKRKL